MNTPNNNFAEPAPYQAEQKTKSKTIMIVFVLIALVVVAGALYYFGFFKQTPKETITRGQMNVLAENKKPSLLPVGFPLIKEDSVIENYDYTDGFYNQSTRKFITSEKPELYYAKVKKFMADRNWRYSNLNYVSDSYITFDGDDNINLALSVDMNKLESGEWEVAVSFTSAIITNVEIIEEGRNGRTVN